MRLSSAIAAVASVALVRAIDHPVQVGANGLSFTPNQLTGVQNGDTVTFEFRAKNHSVTQSTFTNPCQQSVGGVNSGYLFTPPGATSFSQWQITIDNATAPLWFFCAQVNPAVHCHAGMVFAVNANAEKSFDQYQLNANKSTLSFTDAGQPAQPTPTAAQLPPAGQTNGAPPAGGAPIGVGNTLATTAGSVPTGAVPVPGQPLTTGGGEGSGVSPNAAGAAGGAGGIPGAASKTTVGFSGLMGVAIMLGLLL